jgi:CheY-like chemotaxis protein
MNLCTNAAHAMQQGGGVLEVTLEDVDVTEAEYPDVKPGPYVRLAVSDTGSGMDQATVKRIFDPYFTTKEKGVGTGMGLAVVHGIVRGHDGDVIVDSEPGKGTTFQVILPRIDIAVDKASRSSDALPGGDEHILFVDDEDFLVDVARQMLERLGYKVVGKTDSVEALELFKAEPHGFDMIITDQTMPKMTGDMLAREILRIRSDIPILLCTGYSELMTIDQAKALGIQGLIVKPLVIRQLAGTIREILDAK